MSQYYKKNRREQFAVSIDKNTAELLDEIKERLYSNKSVIVRRLVEAEYKRVTGKKLKEMEVVAR